MKLECVPALIAIVPLLGACKDDLLDPRSCDPDADGTICTIAGSGENGHDDDADTTALVAIDAKLSFPLDTLTAIDGSIYIVDFNNHRLRLLDDGMLGWVAGRREIGSFDDPADGDFAYPTNIVFDPNGDDIVVAAWRSSKVQRVNRADGTVTDTCGDGKRAYFGDGGPAVAASLDLPASIAYDPGGNLVIMDQGNQVLRWVDAQGDIHRLAGRCVVDAGMPDGSGSCAEDMDPVQCPDGDNGPSGKLTCGDPAATCPLRCASSYSGDDIPAIEMRMAQNPFTPELPAGRIAFDAAGNLYFADSGNHLIRMIDTAGIVHRVAGQPPVDGVQQRGHLGDGGPARSAMLDHPVDLAFGDDGTLYFTDVGNHCVRAIDPSGTIDTVVGRCGERGFDGDGGAPQDALLDTPWGVEFADGRLLVSDSANHVIRSARLP